MGWRFRNPRPQGNWYQREDPERGRTRCRLQLMFAPPSRARCLPGSPRAANRAALPMEGRTPRRRWPASISVPSPKTDPATSANRGGRRSPERGDRVDDRRKGIEAPPGDKAVHRRHPRLKLARLALRLGRVTQPRRMQMGQSARTLDVKPRRRHDDSDDDVDHAVKRVEGEPMRETEMGELAGQRLLDGKGAPRRSSRRPSRGASNSRRRRS